jgi:hypothetical protein
MRQSSDNQPTAQYTSDILLSSQQVGGSASRRAYEPPTRTDRGPDEGTPASLGGPGLEPAETLSTAGVEWGSVGQDGVVRARLSDVLRAAQRLEEQPTSPLPGPREVSERGSSGAQRPNLDTKQSNDPDDCDDHLTTPPLEAVDEQDRVPVSRLQPDEMMELNEQLQEEISARKLKDQLRRRRDARVVERASDRPAVVLPLPAVGCTPDDDAMAELQAWMRPTGTYRMSRESYRRWLLDTYEWAIRGLRETYGPDVPLVRTLQRRADRVMSCGDEWRIRTCGGCGHQDLDHAHHLDPCRSSGCPICGRSQAQPWRAAALTYALEHPVSRKKGVSSRDYWLDTYTHHEADFFSATTIAGHMIDLKKGVKAVWAKVARFQPRRSSRNGGEYGKYPGKCADAGMLASIEVGPSGNVHAHVLRYGSYHQYADLREAFKCVVPTTEVIEHQALRDKSTKGERTIGELVAEVCKYTVQGSTKSEGEFTHPLVVVLTEIALYRRKLRDGYGSMRNLKKVAKAIERAAEEEAREIAESEGGELPIDSDTPCPHCGQIDWHWVSERRDRPWVPDGWGVSKTRSDSHDHST